MKKISAIYLLILISCSGEITQDTKTYCNPLDLNYRFQFTDSTSYREAADPAMIRYLSLIHISEPTRLGMNSYAVFCLKKKNTVHAEVKHIAKPEATTAPHREDSANG